MCDHRPTCPEPRNADCCRAHVVSDHFEQGWCLLCNGVIVFDDGAYISPDGYVRAIPVVGAAA